MQSPAGKHQGVTGRPVQTESLLTREPERERDRGRAETVGW